jgi:hypothetical protein
MHLVPSATPSFLKLSDVETFYAHETVKVVKITRAMLMTPKGRSAATNLVGHRDDETPSQFAARVISTADPTALFRVLAAGGISENDIRAAYHSCWVSSALRFVRRCREFPKPPFDRIGHHGHTMLSVAINGEAELAVYWLVRSGASPRAPNANGMTALSRSVERCVKRCQFAIDECVHERMKILMLCDVGEPAAGDAFADAMYHEMTRADDSRKRQRNSKK